MPDGINTAMKTVQAPGGQAARNTGWGESSPNELAGRDDAVLPSGDARDVGVRDRFVGFLSQSEKKSTNASISPPKRWRPTLFIAGSRPGAPPNRRSV